MEYKEQFIRSRAIECDKSMEKLRAEGFINDVTYRSILGSIKDNLKHSGLDINELSDIDLYEAAIKQTL